MLVIDIDSRVFQERCLELTLWRFKDDFSQSVQHRRGICANSYVIPVSQCMSRITDKGAIGIM